jgi:acyl carrier protein
MKTFNDIVTTELRIPTEQISDALTPADVPDWDSMSYLLFIGELEKNYSISFSMDEIMNAASLGAVRELVRVKGIDV